MRLATLRRARTSPPLPGVHGTARVDAAAARLAGRARPGDIAVIEHLDLDGGSARLLVAAGVARGRQRRARASAGATPTSGRSCWSRPASRCSTGSAPRSSPGRRRRPAAAGRRHALPRRDPVATRPACWTPTSVAPPMEAARAGLAPSSRRSRTTHRAPAPGARPAARRRAASPSSRPTIAGRAGGRRRPAATAPSEDLRTLRPWLRDYRPGAGRGRRGGRRAARGRAAAAPGGRRPASW